MKVNRRMADGIFMKPVYNTINDTYQDPYKLGKHGYHNNTTKRPVFVEPWHTTGKNGQVFSRFEHKLSEVGSKTKDDARNGKSTGNVEFLQEEENGNQCTRQIGVVVC